MPEADPPTDELTNWNIRSFPAALREDVARRAQMEGKTVGQWLERLIRDHFTAGHPLRIEPATMDAERLAAVADTCLRVAAAAAEGHFGPATRHKAQRLLNAALEAAYRPAALHGDSNGAARPAIGVSNGVTQ